LLHALAPLDELDRSARAIADAEARAPASAPVARPPVERVLLRNIALHHRAHERYYTQHLAEAAVELYREANRLRIVAEAWIDGRDRAASAEIDFADPLQQAAGCDDLNARAAIPAIGVLFMEGEGEPAELRVLKMKLRASAGGARAAGQWLAAKADAAWAREQVLFGGALVAGARARFNTIAANWRGSRELELAGRLLSAAASRLDAIDLRPSALRARRMASAQSLLEVSWIVAMAAQLNTGFAAQLADSDREWTSYLAVLDAAD
jgi:hypothetical protein